MTAPWFAWAACAVAVVALLVACALAWVVSMERADRRRADDLLPDEPVPHLPTVLPWPHEFDPVNCAVCAGIAARERFAAASERIRRMLREEAERQCTWSEQDDAAVAQLLDGAS